MDCAILWFDPDPTGTGMVRLPVEYGMESYGYCTQCMMVAGLKEERVLMIVGIESRGCEAN